MIAHGFLERRKPGARKGQRDGGLIRYQRYLIWVFLLANDGVRQLRASLDFLNGVLVEREELVYGYGSIAAVHVTRQRGGQTFGQGDQDTAEIADEDEEDVVSVVNDNDLDIASITNTLPILRHRRRE